MDLTWQSSTGSEQAWDCFTERLLTGNMRREHNERYDAEHFSQVHVDSVALAQQLSTLGDGVQDVGVKIQVQRQKHGGLGQEQAPHRFVVDEGKASESDGIQMVHAAAVQLQAELRQRHGKEREEELQGQEEPAVHQAPAAAHHCQVNREGNEGDVVEGSRAGQVLGAHHDLTEAGAQPPVAVLLPVNGHGPQAHADQVAGAAPQDEHGHVAPHRARPAEQAGRRRGQDGHVQGEGREEQQDFGRGAEVQVGGHGAPGRGGVHRWRRVEAAASASVGWEGRTAAPPL